MAHLSQPLKKSKTAFVKHQDAGFTIVELIATLALLSFGVIGIYSAFSTMATLHTTIALRFTGAYLAQEGMEIVRNIRDYNFIANIPFDSSISICATGCRLDYKTATDVEFPQNELQPYTNTPLNINSEGFYSYDPGFATPFKRLITVTEDPDAQDGSDFRRVSVLVTWEYKGEVSTYEIVDYLYDWHVSRP